jgi:AcrR family transcriptional regulator
VRGIVAAEALNHRRATAARNVEAILDGAEALLADGAQLSIAAVATRARVSRVTVYSHFDRREAILQAVVERAVARAAVAFDEATAGAPTASEALERALSTAWDRLGRNTAIAEAAASQLSADAVRRTHESAQGRVIARTESSAPTCPPPGWSPSFTRSCTQPATTSAQDGCPKATR